MPAIELQCQVVSHRWITPTVFELRFKTEPDFEFKAGQFASIIIPGGAGNGKDLRRAYSIASEPGTKPIELCVKLVEGGPGTTFLNSLKSGDKFRAFAPYGDFVFKPKPGKGIVFLATGTGIAPFRAMMTSEFFKLNPPADIQCLFGVREENELLYDAEIKSMAGVNWLPWISKPTPAWKGRVGRISEQLKIWDSAGNFNWFNYDYYLCGSGAMILETIAFLKERGVQKDSIHQEIYYRPKKETS